MCGINSSRTDDLRVFSVVKSAPPSLTANRQSSVVRALGFRFDRYLLHTGSLTGVAPAIVTVDTTPNNQNRRVNKLNEAYKRYRGLHVKMISEGISLIDSD